MADHPRTSSPASPSARRSSIMGVTGLTFLAALFIIALDNVAFWHQLAAVSHVGQASGVGFALATATFLVCVLSAMMAVFAFRFIFKPFLIFMLLLAAVISYFMTTYGVVVDDTMIVNTFDTDSGEAVGLFNLSLVMHILLLGVVPSIVVAVLPVHRHRFVRELATRILFIVVMLAIGAGALGIKYKDFSLVLRENRELRMYINPTYAIYSAVKVVKATAKTADKPIKQIGLNAHRTAAAQSRSRREVVIFVVGETTRAADWGLDGYPRNTTPELGKLDIVNFRDAHSCGTSTAISVPCMFSADDRAHFDRDRAAHTQNLLDVLQRAGVTVHWEENQAGGCKGVCDRVQTTSMRTLVIPGVCGDGHCLDAVFLHKLAERINATQGDLLLVMHTMGSHGPDYYERYPADFRFYTPTCQDNRPQQCTSQQLRNSYDNTVRYVDHVLAGLIGVLKSEDTHADTALMYLSDHGESLGENGIYLHGFPYMFAPTQQTHIPMIAWFSPGFLHDQGLSRGCVNAQAGKQVGQDNVFSTVMALMDVTASDYKAGDDIFASCRSGASAPSAVGPDHTGG